MVEGGRNGRRQDSNAEAGPSKQEFEVGARVACKATFDNQYHPGEIIERREDDKGVSYYVHYAECESGRGARRSSMLLLEKLLHTT